MMFQTKFEDIMMCSEETSIDDLIKIASCALSAFCALHPLSEQPRLIVNEWSEEYGNSVFIVGKYMQKVE